ncbi:hypothetical protein K492DRAFT_74417 [Lichtheimia hyalospora FSU 10163]|nr:hypothetical protein K492DRAFT_74417 [Lichtheimia hyalospora FSU 10163]
MGFSTTRSRFGDIKISDRLMTVNVGCHFNALGSSYQQKVSTLEPWQPSSLRKSIFKYCMVALDVFSSCLYLCVYYWIKTWIICAYAICDT